MADDRWQRVADLYQSAQDRAPEERLAFVRQASDGDSGLRREVESLLAQDEKTLVVDRPIAAAANSLLADNAGVQPGSFIGAYRIDSLLGAGGMGEVYRARDTKLDRDVAIKILPPAFANDPDRLARFKREAQVLASLNHPNIATIHGFEDRSGVHALVLELVEGPTLADRLQKGPLAIDEAMAVAKQIAEALEAAHEQGIIHRDLKPANIKVRDDGTVKVLDFGLAKLVEPPDVVRAFRPAGEGGPEGPHYASQSPTITTPAMTAAGMILGTAAYMSPEQAKGRPADKRSDIWAFGCVLYEMLTGRRAFEGDDVAETLAEVIKGTPDWSRLPAVSLNVRLLLHRCLEKDRLKRLGDVAAIRLLLSDAMVIDAHDRPRRNVMVTIVGLVALAAGIGASLAVGAWRSSTPPPKPHVERLTITTPDNSEFLPSPGGGPARDVPPLAISPDGRYIVFGAIVPGKGRGLWLRPLSSFESRLIPGSDEARYPFWSPDSRTIAFMTQGEFRTANIAAGAAGKVTNLDNGLGGSWSVDGTILLAVEGRGLVRTSLNDPRLAPVDFDTPFLDCRFPQFLDSRHFIFLGRGRDTSAIYLAALGDNHATRLVDSDRAAKFAAGQLLYVRGQTLYAQSLDPKTYLPIGRAESLPDPVASTQSTYVALSASGNDRLALASVRMSRVQLAWVDRSGGVLQTIGTPEPQAALFLSRDHQQLLSVRLNAAATGVPATWLSDLAHGTETRVSDGTSPVLSPDGQSVAFRGALRGLFRIGVAGTRLESLAGDTAAFPSLFPTDWSPDGRQLLIMGQQPGRQFDVLLFDLESKQLTPVVHTAAGEGTARFSPNGRLIAYASDESGTIEIFVCPIDDPDARAQISTHGGMDPRWSDDGKSVYFIAGDGTLMMADISMEGKRPRAAAPVALFKMHTVRGLTSFFGGAYAVDSTRGRFLVMEPADTSPGTISVILNWPQALGAVP
jgi:serine/threonine protein kinase